MSDDGDDGMKERHGASRPRLEGSRVAVIGIGASGEAAAILAAAEDRPTADAIAAEARDILLMGMTTAVMDVDSVASELGGDLEPKEIQQKVEGRQPISLREYALLHQELAARGA